MTQRKPQKRLKRRGPKPAAKPSKIREDARRLEALRLRAGGFDYAQIGEWLDPPVSRSRACEIVRDALVDMSASAAELAEHVRAIELQRLDDMFIKPFEAAKQGDTRAIDACLKIMDRRAQILGLDAPKKQEHTGPAGGPIPFTRIERVVVDLASNDQSRLA